MQIDFIKFIYLFIRMSPFIVVSYFSLQSMFNRDLKGLIYLSGLLITCIIAASISANGLLPQRQLTNDNTARLDVHFGLLMPNFGR